MSDPTTEAIEPPVTTDPGPATGGTPEEVNYQQRYDDLRPQYDRTMQELQTLKSQQEALRNDPDAQRQFLTELGYDVAEPEQPEFPDDPIAGLRAEYDQRLAAIEQQNQQAMTNLEIASHEQHVGRELSELAADQGGKLSEKYQDAVIRLGYQMRDDNGLPQLKAAADLLNGVSEEQMQNWSQTKKTPHRVSPNGAAGTEQPNMDDPAERQAWMAQRLADLENS